MLIGSIIILLANVHNYLKKKRFNESRAAVVIEDLYESNFSNLNKKDFLETWISLAKVLEVEPNKLLPSDTIEQLADRLHLHEMYYDGIDTYLRDRGVESGNVTVNTPVDEIISTLIISTKCKGKPVSESDSS